jgi:hypothetical protein
MCWACHGPTEGLWLRGHTSAWVLEPLPFQMKFSSRLFEQLAQLTVQTDSMR